jgi:hypothetical protein
MPRLNSDAFVAHGFLAAKKDRFGRIGTAKALRGKFSIMTEQVFIPEAAQTQNPAAAQKPKATKGHSIKIAFASPDGTPNKDGLIMVMHLLHSKNTYQCDLAQLMQDHPAVAMKILQMGAKTIASNSVNTIADKEEAENNLLSRLAAWQEGSYTSGLRGTGTPLFILAFSRALREQGKPEEEIETRSARLLSTYRLEGDALSPDLIALRAQIETLDEDDETQAKERNKLIKKHQTTLRSKFLGGGKYTGIPEVIAARDAIVAERGRVIAASIATSLDDF